MFQIKPDAYGPYLAPLLITKELNPLGPGKPVRSTPAELASFDVARAFAPHPVRDPKMARACEAGLWLLYNQLERSHELSQEIKSPAGSYWHGLMHRREPDFGNAKYWFHRLGTHPIFGELCPEAAQLAGDRVPGAKLLSHSAATANYLTTQRSWDPFRFIDLCEETIGSDSPTEELCRRIQQCEWGLLFDFCYQRAIGREREPKPGQSADS